MDITEALTVVVPSILGAGGLGALVNNLVTRRKNDQTNEGKVREDLRSIVKEERTEARECQAKVDALTEKLTIAMVAHARCDTRVSILETQQAEWRQAMLKAYLDSGGKSIPPKAEP